VLPHTGLKIIQMSVIIKWDERFGLDVFHHDINSWKVPLNIVISIEVLLKGISCSELSVISCHGGNDITGFKA
jgi:hypothetical protein